MTTSRLILQANVLVSGLALPLVIGNAHLMTIPQQR